MIMTDKDGGEAAVGTESHDNDDHDHGQRQVDRSNADEEDDEERGESFQCVDCVSPSGAADDNHAVDHGDRVSFATAFGDRLQEDPDFLNEEEDEENLSRYDYGMWMAAADEPMSIKERRRRLLQGMGLNSSRDLLRTRNPRISPHIPRFASRLQPAAIGGDRPSTSTSAQMVAAASPDTVERQPNAGLLTRCRSDDSRLASQGRAARKHPSFRRVYSLPHSLHGSPVDMAHQGARCPSPPAACKDKGNGNNNSKETSHGVGVSGQSTGTPCGVGNEPQTGQTGGQMSVDDLGQFIRYSPLVKQITRRSQSQKSPAGAAAKRDTKPAKQKPRWLKNIMLVASVANRIHEKDRDGNARDRSSVVPSAVSMSRSASVNASPTASTNTDRLKVHHSGISSKELTGLYMRQELRAHEGSVWTLKFSPDGRLLASGGEDRMVRVWQVVDADASSLGLTRELSSAHLPLIAPGSPTDEGQQQMVPRLAAQLSKKVRRVKNNKSQLPEHVVVPETMFELAKKPFCVLAGHLDDVLDLSWSQSQSQRLLSSSMDKTVRLWDTESKTCLKLFAHSDYVTCIQFNPVDDGYFISGSLDCKVRIWSVEECQVVDWSDLNDMVTAACYTPDGQAAIVGSHKGSCRFYKTKDCKLNQEAQIDMSISKKRRSQAKKITGFQFAPNNPSEILVTSADSQIRVSNGITVLQKFKGFKNTSSQISASYSGDGRYVVCASEDSHVYVWSRGGAGGMTGGGGRLGVKAKTWLTSRSYEYFFCRDVSAAVPWPRSPSFCSASVDSSYHGRNVGRKPDRDAPLPRRAKSGSITYPGGQVDLLTRGVGSRRLGAAEGGNAWGMVVVTASLAGEIRVYQNFGLPQGIRG